MAAQTEIGDWYVQQTLADPLWTRLQQLHTQRICVMGGCGQVGSHILAQLYILGIPVAHLTTNDDLRLGTLDNLPAALREQNDARSHLDYAHHPPQRPDIVIFVGGRSSAPHFSSLDDVRAELETWQAVLEWCVREQIRLIFASTSSLCKARPSLETQRVWPGSLYELAKLTMEEMAIQQALTEGLTVQICRFFSVYGITEQHKGSIGNLYTQILWHALAQQPFPVWGQPGHFEPGEQTRDIIFAPEVARALLFLLTQSPPQPTLTDISDLIYNIGQGEPLSVNAMIQQVAALLPPNRQPQVVTAPVPPNLKNYVVHTWGNPAKLHQAGFIPWWTDHSRNLNLIFHALEAGLDWYWALLTQIREVSGPAV